MGFTPPTRDRTHRHRTGVQGDGPSLHGEDRVNFIASNTKIQKQRWMDIYYRLWERKAKVDIADVILISNGTPCDWFFTSSVTGEIHRKTDAHLNAIAIKKHFIKNGDTSAISREIAYLFHEDSSGDMAYALLNDLDFNLELCHDSSPLWKSSFILEAYLHPTLQHPQFPGTFVAKLHTSSSIRVLHVDTAFHELKRTFVRSAMTITPVSTGLPSSFPSTSTCRPSSAMAMARARGGNTSATLPRGVEELIRTELIKIVAEIEAATKETLKQIHAEFQITRTHRLMLVRLSHVVYGSDLQTKSKKAHAQTGLRPTSARHGGAAKSDQCAGRCFCDKTAFATGELTKTSTTLAKSRELQQITRKSLQLCEEESIFLDKFGAHAEAQLESFVPRGPASHDTNEVFKRILQRRIFMLRSTLWNPESDSFHAKPLAWEDEAKKQSQLYEMVRVCRTCYLIYHTMDAERFQATKSTVKAAARRLTMLHNAKMIGEKQHKRSQARSTTAAATWEVEVDEDRAAGDDVEVAAPVVVPKRRAVKWAE